MAGIKPKLKKHKSISVYELWRDSPVGNVSMGLFRKEKDALKEREEWNKEYQHVWDKAYISVRHVKC